MVQEAYGQFPDMAVSIGTLSSQYVSHCDDESLMGMVDRYAAELHDQKQHIELGAILARFPGIESRSIPFDIAIETVIRDLVSNGMSVDDASGILLANYPNYRDAIARSCSVSMLLAGIGARSTTAAMRDPPSEIGPLLDSGRGKRYRLNILCGEGAYAKTYLSTDRLLSDEHGECKVAVKLLDVSGIEPESVSLLLAEANRASAIRHTNVVQVRDRGVDQAGWAYIVMEYVSGGTLLDWRSECEREFLNLSIQLADGLQAIHSRGVIHSDIKPQNVLLAEYGQSDVVPKMADFGVARVLEESDRVFPESQSTGVYGNVAFQSPEVYEGGESQSTLSDVYALATMLLYVATGRLPHPDRGCEAPAESDAVNRLSISHRLRCVLIRASDPDPNIRTRSAAELAGQLRAIRDYRPIDRIDSSYQRTRLWGKRHPVARFAAAVVAAAGPVLIVGGSKAREGWAYERGKREVASQVLSIDQRLGPALSARDTVYDMLDAFMARELIRHEEALSWMMHESQDIDARCRELETALAVATNSVIDELLIREQLILHSLQSRKNYPATREHINTQRLAMVAAGLIAEMESDQLRLFEAIAVTKEAVLSQSVLTSEMTGQLRQHLEFLDLYIHRYLTPSDELSADAARDPRVRLALRAAEWLSSEKLLDVPEYHKRYKGIYLE